MHRALRMTMNVCTVYKLTVCSFMMGCVSVGLLSLAVSTDSWLLTREFMSTPSEDATGNITDYKTWLTVWTGLWRFCVVDENLPDEVYCMAVDYGVSSTGRGESGAITTTTIIGAARAAVALPASALVFSIAAVIFSVVGNIRQDVKTLVGGILFILAGLSLAVGMILYISAINDEVGYRSSTSKHEGGFSYAYGWSFYTAGFGFLASELSAVVTITLFLRRNENLEDMARIIPGLEDKVALGSCASREHQVAMGCHCRPGQGLEDGGGLEDGCCSLCCPEEFHNRGAEERPPWRSFACVGGGGGGGACGGQGGACGGQGGACGGQPSGSSDGGSSSSRTADRGRRSVSVSA